MLKIKGKIDLKELEKFGFKYNKFYNAYEKQIYESDCNLVVDADRVIYHENYTTADMNGCARELAVAIFDLIQAGLVEKVEDKGERK